MPPSQWLALAGFGTLVIILNNFDHRAALWMAGALLAVVVITHSNQLTGWFGGGAGGPAASAGGSPAGR